MQANPLLKSFHDGSVALGGWLSTSLPITAEAMAAQELEYVCIDMQHGLINHSDIPAMLAAITGRGPTSIVRVPWNTPDHIGKALDSGAMGVIVPMVNSVEECDRAVYAASYPPRGGRSYGPVRAMAVEGPDYFGRANTEIAIIPMIETTTALDAIDDILSVEGVSAIYVGPADLGISMGLAPGADEPPFLSALDRIVERCNAHGVVPGIHANAANAQDRLARGFRMVTITSDLVALRAKLTDDVTMVRAGLTGSQNSAY